MPRRIDPRFVDNLIDAHVLDRKGNAEDVIVDTILELADNGTIILLLPYSVRDEINHPNTPAAVKHRALGLLFSAPVQLTGGESELYGRVLSLVQGNARSGKHDRDAFHLVESAKYGGYFLTNEKRLLKRGAEIRDLLGIEVVTPTEFLGIVREFEGT